MEVVIKDIHDHLEDLAQKMRSGELPIEQHVIMKGLSKHPNDYPDVEVNRPFTILATTSRTSLLQLPMELKQTSGKSLVAERTHHPGPEEIARSGGALKPDVEWYLTQQILPHASRLVEPVEGLSQKVFPTTLALR